MSKKKELQQKENYNKIPKINFMLLAKMCIKHLLLSTWINSWVIRNSIKDFVFYRHRTEQKGKQKLANKTNTNTEFLFVSWRSHKKTLTLTGKHFIIQTFSFGKRIPRVYRVGDNNISALWIYKLNLTFMFCLYVEN